MYINILYTHFFVIYICVVYIYIYIYMCTLYRDPKHLTPHPDGPCSASSNVSREEGDEQLEQWCSSVDFQGVGLRV